MPGLTDLDKVLESAPFRQFRELAKFTEWLAPSRIMPASPRILFGAMPAAVANAYFGRQHLWAVGLYTAHDITIGAGPWLYHDGELLSAPELHIRPELVTETPLPPATPSPGHKADGPHVLIVGHGYEIYGHWLAEILPKLGVLHAAGLDLDSLRLLLPHDTPGFALEMLRLLGFTEAQFVRFGGPFGSVTVGELIASSFLHNGVRYAATLEPTVRLLRERVERRFGRLAQGEYPSRVCIARRGGNRPCANRDMFESECAAAGFRIIAPETLPLLEQWRLFADAREIIGEYGSALHGAIFSRPGTIVCGLRGSGMHPGFIQSGIGEQLLQPTGYVFGVNESDDKGPFHIDPTDLKACLQLAFTGAPAPMAAPSRAAAPEPLDSVEAYLAAHDDYLQAGFLAEAHRALRNALRRDAEAPGAQARLARLLDRMQAPGALAAIDAALSQGEAAPENFALRARLLLRAERHEDAVVAAEMATKLAPESAEAWRTCAQAALQAGRKELAIEAARRAAALAPEEIRPQLLLFEALMAQGQSSEAAALIEALHRRAPRKAAVACAYARLLLESGEVSRALPVALAALMEGEAHAALKALVDALVGALAAERAATPAALAADIAVKRAFAIDFAAAGNSAAHRVSGWSEQEDERVWAIGPSSVLLLPPLDPATDWSLEIHASPLTHPPSLPAQRLTLRMGEAVLLEESLTKRACLRALLPKELFAPGQPLSLVLDHPDYATPSEIGMNTDMRPLAVSFRLIRVEPSRIRSADSPGGRNSPPAA